MRWVGRRAVMAACSDIVAAGADPEILTVGLGWPSCRTETELTDLYEGIADACDELRLRLAGGDWQRAECVTLHCAVSGRLPDTGRPLRPEGRVGDMLVVSQPLGDAWLGLHTPDISDSAPYRLPQLSRAFASIARQHPAVHGMTDITDGLLHEIALVASNSHCGAVLELDAIPRSSNWLSRVRPMEQQDDVLAWLLGSDEYALLAAVDPARWDELRTAVEKSGHSVYAVGLLEQGNTLRCVGSIPPQASHLISPALLNQIAARTLQSYA